MSEFYRTKHIKKAKVASVCDWCGEKCLAGEPRTDTASVDGGDFCYSRYHVECHEAVDKWSRMHRHEDLLPETHTMRRGEPFPK